MSSSVLIIDDHPLVRDGVRRSLTAAGFNCVGEAGSLKEAIAMIALHNPDVVTVDLNLPDGSGLEVISWARKNSATIAIIVLTLEDDLELISAACQAGAQGFISKSQSADHLISAINSVLAQPQVFISNQTIALLGREKFQGLLSPREMMVLTHLNGELSVVEIARAIFVSEATVKSHCASIYRKLETHSRRSAVARAKTIGLL
ncbi:MAG: response regulator transcription factor [Candidatus Planktophila sp.]|nr:response regulator transcription factor [Candidatus Planktophila sp.]